MFCEIIFFLSGEHLLKKSAMINTDILHGVYSNVVLLVKQEPYAI